MEYTPGDVIESFKAPLVRYLNGANKKNRCNHCFQCKDVLPKCSACNVVYYCNKQCQESDWKNGHSLECKLYRLIPSLINNDTMGQIVRFVSWLKIRKPYHFSESPRFLTSIEEKIKRTPSIATKLSSVASDLSNSMLFTTTECSYDSIVRTRAVWKLNGVIVPYEDNSGHLGTVLYMINRTLPHSCNPNAIQVVHSSLTMQIRCIDGISAGHPPTISRIFDIRRRNHRRKLLMNQFSLKCHCELCELEKQNVFVDYSSLNIAFLKISQMPFYTDELLVLAKEIVSRLCKIVSRYDGRITLLYENIVDKALFTLESGRPEFTSKITICDLKQFVSEAERNVRISIGIKHQRYKYLNEEILPKIRLL